MAVPYDHQYPFDSRYPFLSVPPAELIDITDFQLQLREAGTPGHRLSFLRGVTSVDANPAVTVIDSEDTVVFSADSGDSTYSSRAWSSEYTVHTWRRATGACQIVVNAAPVGGDFSGEIELDPRAVAAMPPAVTRVVVNSTENEQRLFLKAGYNCSLEVETAAVAPPNINRHAVTIALSPGLGLGRFPGCDDAIYLKTINGREPDERGNFNIQGDGCYYYTLPATHEVRLHSDCAPCWSCEQFKEIYEALKRVYLAYKEQSQSIESIRRQQQSLAMRWNEVIACRNDNNLKVVTAGLSNGRASVTFRYRNTTDLCQEGVQLLIAWDSDVLAVTDSGLVTYGNGDRPRIELPGAIDAGEGIDWGTILPGRTARYRYTVYLLEATVAEVTATIQGGGSGGPVTESVELP